MCDKKITQTPLKSRLFKFKSHPHGVFGVWHLLKSHYEKWVQKSPEALRHLGFLGWHPLRMHNMVAGVGFEPHDLRVMSPTSYQTALPRDIQFQKSGAGSRGRTGTILTYHGILSPGRLPIPPHRHFWLPIYYTTSPILCQPFFSIYYFLHFRNIICPFRFTFLFYLSCRYYIHSPLLLFLFYKFFPKKQHPSFYSRDVSTINHSTVTLFARFFGLSISQPFFFAV